MSEPLTQEQALIAILTQQRNAAMDGLAQLAATAEIQRIRLSELEAQGKKKP